LWRAKRLERDRRLLVKNRKRLDPWQSEYQPRPGHVQWLKDIFTTLIGGLLISTFGRVLAVLLTACRVDIEKIWWDEILGIALGGALLWHFGNGWVTIALFAFTDLAPSLLPALGTLFSKLGLHERAASTTPQAELLPAGESYR
jgi:hypothetical protein